jgi:signal transduction histidine kinase
VIDASGSVAGEVPELISRTAFRIAQEALTNARKHAPGAAIGVRIDGHAGGLLAVEVTNGTARAGAASIPGSGVGLAGLAERVELAGGTLEYGPDGKGGFAVRAWLPWEECDD